MERRRATTVCLSMIVKDEAAVIERCLSSARPHIDAWCVVDTGSTDDTQKIVKRVMADMPGQLHERPWLGFAQNRTEALQLARSLADYSLMLDADEVLVAGDGFGMPTLTAGAYSLLHRLRDIGFQRVQLTSNAREWRYEGALHSYPVCESPCAITELKGLVVENRGDGARGKDSARRFLRDAEILEEAIQADPTSARSWFYLAQSYRDGGNVEKALAAYEHRAFELEGWIEERWHAAYEAAIMKERLQRDFGEIVLAYLEAFQMRPTRAEPLMRLSKLCRGMGHREMGLVFASRAMRMRRPSDSLFVEESIYAWRALDEYAIGCYWSGEYEEAIRANTELLANPNLPARERGRVEKNRRFAEKKMGQKWRRSS